MKISDVSILNSNIKYRIRKSACSKFDVNSSQLAKMKKSIPDMSLP